MVKCSFLITVQNHLNVLELRSAEDSETQQTV